MTASPTAARTRFAPAPTGYLHLGHVANATWVWGMARQAGARVVVADIQDERGAALAAELGSGAAFQHADVTNEHDVKAVVGRATTQFGRLDCMFNNAGLLGTVGPVEEIPLDEYERTMQVLLRSVFLGMKHASPVMKAQGLEPL